MGHTISFIIVLALAGAGAFWYNHTHPTATEPSHPVAENPEGEADPARMTLGMGIWVWQEAKEFSVTFGDEGRFTATTDCNAMGGSYVATKTTPGAGTISFSQIFSTQMYCAGSREGEFAALLGEAKTYHFDGRGQLILDLSSGKTAVFQLK